MSLPIDYSRYQTLNITRRGANQTVLDIQMKAGGPGGNGKLPTAGHEGHAELAEIWRDVSRDDSVRAAVLRGEGLGFSGGGDLSLVDCRWWKTWREISTFEAVSGKRRATWFTTSSIATSRL
ncbi:MAG: 6-oxocamphor hydrolase [Pseudomonadota bacterium]